MPTKRRQRAKVSPTIRRKRPTRHYRDLLIIECQAALLLKQSLNVGSQAKTAIESWCPGKKINLVQTSSVSQLCDDLGSLAGQNIRYRAILLVGHSNERGLCLTDNAVYTWNVVGQWLAKFEPKSLFLAACKAGRSNAVRELFVPLPSLRIVCASPTALYGDQTPGLIVLVASALHAQPLDGSWSFIVRTLNYCATQSQLYVWKRSGIGEGKEVTGSLWDLAADLFNARR